MGLQPQETAIRLANEYLNLQALVAVRLRDIERVAVAKRAATAGVAAAAAKQAQLKTPQAASFINSLK